MPKMNLNLGLWRKKTTREDRVCVCVCVCVCACVCVVGNKHSFFQGLVNGRVGVQSGRAGVHELGGVVGRDGGHAACI